MADPRTAQGPKLDEKKLAEAADSGVAVDVVRDGRPLPDSIDNPQCGTYGHYCLDPQKNYQKSWYQLKLHKVDGMPQRQWFNCAGKKYKVLVGAWVDVPPWVIEVLSMCVEQQVRQGYDISDPLGMTERTEIVDEKPRFSYSSLPSA